MSKEDFQARHNIEGELSAFEQQLRSIDPTPPKTQWQDMPQLLFEKQGESVDSVLESTVAPSTHWNAGWQRIVTHAAATLVGIGIGVTWVMLQQPAVVTAPPADTLSPRVAVEQETSDAASGNVDVQQMVSQQKSRGLKRHAPSMIGYRNGSRPLTALTGNIEARQWQSMPHDIRPVALEEPTVTLESSELDKPMSAPELMLELLNEHANAPKPHSRDVG